MKDFDMTFICFSSTLPKIWKKSRKMPEYYPFCSLCRMKRQLPPVPCCSRCWNLLASYSTANSTTISMRPALVVPFECNVKTPLSFHFSFITPSIFYIRFRTPSKPVCW
ncbi:unnamed protein product [Amoebophrya sp. A120]|nr:unnamed protein product [Amoebophrya sp. A120]|eukprot:GSA120T00008241001.1